VSVRLMTVAIRQEQDVVAARQRARQISALLGFEAQDQARIATAVSEIARNAFRYAGGGLGLGLGGAKRLSNEFSVHSRVGEGTRVTLTRWK